MKQPLYILLVIFSFGLTYGQDYSGLFLNQDSAKGVIIVDAYTAVQSNSLRNDFINKFLFGGYIDEQMKGASRERLGNNNYLNAYGSGKLTYVDFVHAISKKNGIYPSLSLSTTFYGGGRFNQDFYDVAMYGNSPSRKYELDNTFALQYLTQGVHLGFHHRESGSSFSIGLVNGSSFNYIDVNKLHFATNAQAEEIGVIVNGKAAQNIGNPYFATSGIGFSINATYNFNVNFGEGDSATVWPFQFVVKDFGMVFWNENSTTYIAEGAFDYSGVNTITGDGFNVIGDIIPEEAITEKTERTQTFLTGHLGFHKTPRFSQKGIQPIFGVDVFFTQSVIPRGYLGAFFKPANWFDMDVAIAYGGFGGIQDHLGIGFKVMDSFRLSVYSDNTFSAMMDSGYGYSVGLSLIGQW